MKKEFVLDKGRFGVGGGARTHTFVGRVVIRNGALPPGWVRRYGHLACSSDQALVGPELGDIILELSGQLPANPENPDVGVQAWRVTTATATEIAAEEISPPDGWKDHIPWAALDTWHNRDGSAFVTA